MYILNVINIFIGSTTPTQNGTGGLFKSGGSRMDTLKNWSISTYKCTKQLMYEKLGKSSRTIDTGNLSVDVIQCNLNLF